jgi:hypothetical protein
VEILFVGGSINLLAAFSKRTPKPDGKRTVPSVENSAPSLPEGDGVLGVDGPDFPRMAKRVAHMAVMA